jgi:hypothetical protein
MNQTIDLSPQDTALIAASLASDMSRIERLIAKLSAPGAKAVPSHQAHWPDQDPHTVEAIPAPGQPWASQGGIYAGALPALDGQGIEHLILGDFLKGDVAWGEYGKELPGTSSRTDGKANTAAMLEAQSPAAIAINNYSQAVEFDWHIPSQQEAQLISATCFEHMEKATIWTSSQYSAYGAWCQSFLNGNSLWNGKDSSLRVRPVRRFKF